MVHTCPHCQKPLAISDVASRNIDRYHTLVLVNTECCGLPVTVRPLISYVITTYTGTRINDDWGKPIKHIAP